VAGAAELLELLRGRDTSPDAAQEAFRALGRALPLAEVELLALDPSVLRHDAAPVRRDAACALGVLRSAQAAALLPLLDDEDLTVARAAWISLWTVTGRAFGLEDDDLFAAPPAQPEDLEEQRDGLFLRPGVSAAQRVATEAMLRDEERRVPAAARFRELLGVDRGDDRPWPAYAP
jgi:hypothetical protein